MVIIIPMLQRYRCSVWAMENCFSLPAYDWVFKANTLILWFWRDFLKNRWFSVIKKLIFCMNPDTDADPAIESCPNLDLGQKIGHQVIRNTKYGRNGCKQWYYRFSAHYNVIIFRATSVISRKIVSCTIWAKRLNPDTDTGTDKKTKSYR